MCLDIQRFQFLRELKVLDISSGKHREDIILDHLTRLFEERGKIIKRYVETGFSDQNVLPGYDGKILKSSFLRINDTLKQFEEGAYNTELDLFDILGKEKGFRNH